MLPSLAVIEQPIGWPDASGGRSGHSIGLLPSMAVATQINQRVAAFAINEDSACRGRPPTGSFP